MNFLFRVLIKIRYTYHKCIIGLKRKYYTYIVSRAANPVGIGLKVNGLSFVTTKTQLGDNVNFNGMTISGEGNISIGDNFHSGPGCIIISGYHNYDNGNAIPYDSTYTHKDVTIEDNVWLGTNVTILGGVTIGEGAIIQIGSVVVSNIPPLAIAGGHPAKVYKYRDKEHYYKLKDLNQFH